MTKPKKLSASAIIAKLDEPEEMTELEVQHLLEERDRGGKPAPVPVAEYLEAALPPVPPALHALDMAPVNSKIVVVETGAVLARPDAVTLLPKSDPASTLPVGAKILKTPTGYVSEQLSPTVDHPLLLTASAAEAITMFVGHFHP